MRVCVITATRAEYGLLYPLLKKMHEDPFFQVDIVISGTHLIDEFGNTKEEVYNDNLGKIHELAIIDKIPNCACDISRIMGIAISKFAAYLVENRPDIAIILGDRYEMVAFALALVNDKVPIAHLNGGEVTGGALDEIYRHCITKMSTLHFTNCETHKKRVIQMGENPENVYNVGDVCVDNIVNTKLYSLKEIEQRYDLALEGEKIIVVTFHPITMETDSLNQLENLLQAIDLFNDYFFLFTMANSDEDGQRINKRLKEYTAEHHNTSLVPSLGRVGYLSVLSHAIAVLGNSSSGLYEVPYFKIPTVNVGDRQKNRLHGNTVIDCCSDRESVVEAMKKALSSEFINNCKKEQNIWGEGDSAVQIVQIIKQRLIKSIPFESKFYDVTWF